MENTPATKDTNNLTNATTNAKNIATVVTLGVVAFSVYQLSSIFSKGDNQKDNEDKTNKAIADIGVNQNQLTKNILVYRTAAETIFGELSNRILVVNLYDFNKIRAQLDGYNTDELKMIIKEFGTRPNRLFNLLEVGGGGSLFDWFDAVLDDTERETIRQYFVFTGLDKAPKKGMALWFNVAPTAKLATTGLLWKPFYLKMPAVNVYPATGNIQYLNANYNNKNVSIKPMGFGVLGVLTGLDGGAKTVAAKGVSEIVKIKITDTRLTEWYGKEIWINTRFLNQTPAPNTTNFPK